MIVHEAPTHPSTGAETKASPLARPLNVLMVTDHLGHANGVIHGASQYYLQVLPRLDPARFAVTLCILRGYHPFAEELGRAGIRPVFLGRGKWDVRAMGDLLRIVRDQKIDLLHCLAMKGCLFGRLAGRLTGTPALIHTHDLNDPGRVIGFLQRRIAPWTARALAVSGAVHRYTVEQLGVAPDRVETLHNGLDLAPFQAATEHDRRRARQELDLKPDDFAILLAGRIVESKGQRLMIGAMPRILQQQPHARLLIVGDGPDLPSCRDLAEQFGVGDAMRFTGQRRDMPHVTAAADAAVMASLQEEGFGFTALEAAAAGKPVVAFGGGAIAEIVEHGRSGFVVSRGDSDGLVNGLLHLAADPERAREMGFHGASLARRFDIRHHVQRLEELYSELARTALHSPGDSR
jgi:glycosyltransferase involved in cell wall biosynthesis